MNSNPSNSQKGSAVPLNNFKFDFDLGSNFSSNRSSQPLKDQKQQPSPYQSSSYTQQPKPTSTTAWTPNKPSWTHQPAPSPSVRSEILNSVSMVGDIHGKSWASKPPATTTSSSSGIGIVEKNPNLFSDLVGPALGQNKSNSNVPLKNAAPVSSFSAGMGATKSAYSMGNMASSLPHTNAGGAMKGGPGYGYAASAGSGSDRIGNMGGGGGLGMKSGGMGSVNKDPFVSLVDFGSKKDQGVKINAAKASSNSNDADFGDFQNARKPSVSSNQFSSKNNDFVGTNSVPSSKTDGFGDFQIPIGNFGSQKQATTPQSSGVDPLDSLFSSSTGAASAAKGSEPFSEMDDWDMGEGLGGDHAAGSTTELEGLPPPPAGVTASAAKNKGLDSYKQGQHADAIKWLSWAVVLLEKAGESATTEVLSCRASCYKEVGEYKKAIADCTKVLEQDGTSVSVLLQRASLYESTEKYKLGAEDLRTVMKIDPGNRQARSTIHRLLQLAD